MKRTALAFAALSIVLFSAFGGDLPTDRVLEMPDCQRLRDGKWLQAIVWQRQRYADIGFHDCYYGLDYPEGAL